jgi:ATP-dependent Clp protease protease subunit
MPNVLRNGKIFLYGYVGDSFFEEGFTSSEVVDALIEVGPTADIDVHVNSGGGNAFEGLAIYSALTAHKGRVTVKVDAIAASAASLIAMAGDEIIMAKGAMMMIHDPATITAGTADEHRKQSEFLEKVADSMAALYGARMGDDAEAARAIMVDETWFTDAEAVEAGFADKVAKTKAKPVTAFAYGLYKDAPREIIALAKKNGWKAPNASASAKPKTPAKPAASTAAPPARIPVTKGTNMTDNTEGNGGVSQEAISAAIAKALADDRKARAAIRGLPEARGKEELAMHLFESGLDTDAIKAALVLAGGKPKPAEGEEDDGEEGEEEAIEPAEDATPAAHEARRVRAAGLLPDGSKGEKAKKPVKLRVDITERMRARFPVPAR